MEMIFLNGFSRRIASVGIMFKCQWLCMTYFKKLLWSSTKLDVEIMKLFRKNFLVFLFWSATQ